MKTVLSYQLRSEVMYLITCFSNVGLSHICSSIGTPKVCFIYKSPERKIPSTTLNNCVYFYYRVITFILFSSFSLLEIFSVQIRFGDLSDLQNVILLNSKTHLGVVFNCKKIRIHNDLHLET